MMKSSKRKSESYDDILFPGEGGARSSSSEKRSISAGEAEKGSKTELLIGSTFDQRYEVLEELGKGGMGRVYKVLDKEVNETVALKLLNPEIAGDEETVERFRNELKLARKISHRNVCRMFDLRKDGGTYYITMEYVPGGDLKSSIRRRGPLNPGKAVFIAKQVCQGLMEAHTLGVIHCDLKSQNVMIDEEGSVRIVDFGVARSLRAKGVTETGIMIGTPEYMSVEQVEGKKVDQRSDIYSLGIIMYEMVTGKVPFAADTPLSTALKQITQSPTDPREVNAEIPEDLSCIILRCLEKDVEKRYQSAEQLLTELCSIEKDLPATQILRPGRRPLIFRQVSLIFAPRKLLFMLLGLAAILFTGVFLWHSLSRKEIAAIPTSKPSLAILPFQNDSGNQSLDGWTTGLSQMLTADLRQSKFISVSGGERVFSILSKMDLLTAENYSSEDLKKVAIQAGVDHVLRGSFSKADEGFEIITKVEKQPAGLVISSGKAECKGGKEIPGKMDELTRKIKLDLGLSTEQVSKDCDEKLEKIITGSPEAYNYYIQGWQNQIQVSDPRQTVKLMQKAIELDPEFAMAYRLMARAQGELGLFSEMWNSLRKANGLKHRLSVRDYLLTQGELYSMSEETHARAIESYERLLREYTGDRGANLNLGLMFCYDLEEWEKATDRFQALIQKNEVSGEPYVAQAEAYMARGMYNRGKEILSNYLTTFPDQVWIGESISNLYLCQGELELALREAGEALSKNPSSVSPSLLGDIYHCSGDLMKAEEEYNKMMEDQEPTSKYHTCFKLAALRLSQGEFEESKRMLKQAITLAEKMGEMERKMWSHFYLARVHLASGKPNHALEEWEQGMKIATQENLDLPVSLHLKGLIYLGMGSMDKAQKTAEQLRDILQKRNNKKLMRYYYHLAGSVELKRQNHSEAITYLKRALSLLPFQHSQLDDHAIFIYPLASAYYESRDFEEAQKEYRRIISLTTGRLFSGDIFAKSLYMLARIFQEQGQEKEAIEHYARFIGLWKNADTEIPELEDAKKRLHKLGINKKQLADMTD